jgi:hypothetical protein
MKGNQKSFLEVLDMARVIAGWNPKQYKTGCCGEWLFSRFPGEYRKCTCGFSGIDQTDYYARFNGNFTGEVREGGEEGGVSQV